MDGLHPAPANGAARSGQSRPARPSGAISAQRLLALLTRQKYLIDQLVALAKRQSPLVRDGSAESLLDLLRMRQELIDRILTAQAEVGPLADALESGAMTESEREQAAEMIESIKAALSEIVQQDDVDRQAINGISESPPAATSPLHTRQARQAYTRSI